MKTSECSVCIAVVIFSLGLVLGFGYFSVSILLLALGAAAITFSVTSSVMFSTVGAVVTLFGVAVLTHYGIVGKSEAFNVRTPPSQIASDLRAIKSEFNYTKPDVEEPYYDGNEGFINQVFQNISKAGYTSPGFGVGAPLVEGFQDENPSKKELAPAPTIKKEELAVPFKLGEIPSQVKNGPHIDVSSTLMKAIQDLNPEQINAMTKDTKQLIDTQKSLMGMLGTMKPMMQDGKELMETFQQMFGK
jgi:hypothetical protein